MKPFPTLFISLLLYVACSSTDASSNMNTQQSAVKNTTAAADSDLPANNQPPCGGIRWACLSPTPLGTINDQTLSNSAADTLKRSLATLSPIQKEITTKPEYTLQYQLDGENHTVTFFVQESFIFEGPFFDAWDLRMRGNNVSGFVLTDQTAALLSTLKKLPQEALIAVIAPPRWEDISKIVPMPITTTAKFLRYTETMPVGPTQFVAIGGAQSKFHKLPTLWLIHMERVKHQWNYKKELLFDYELPPKELKAYQADCGKTPIAHVFMTIEDIDWDGMPEAIIRHKLETCGNEHSTSDTRVVIFNVGETITKALDVLGNSNTMKGEHVRHKQLQTQTGSDDNDDGHPDFSIRFEEIQFLCNLGKEDHREEIRNYHWIPQSDTYQFSNHTERIWQTNVNHSDK